MASFSETPLDHPNANRPHRVYVTLTNHCNRACPWCSTCSSPRGGTWLSLEDCKARLPSQGLFEIQLEGGEPTVHPLFWDFVSMAQVEPRCSKLILCTNGVLLPRKRKVLIDWLRRLGEPLTLKLSINHYLLSHDPDLLRLALLLKECFDLLGGDRLLVLNIRLRKGSIGDEENVLKKVEEAGLLEHANVFHLQRYGFASTQESWDPPYLVGTNFSIINPDGSLFGPDLVGRSEAMRRLG